MICEFEKIQHSFFSQIDCIRHAYFSRVSSAIQNMNQTLELKRKLVIVMCLRVAQTHKNKKEFFSYFEPLNYRVIIMKNDSGKIIN